MHRVLLKRRMIQKNNSILLSLPPIQHCQFKNG